MAKSVHLSPRARGLRGILARDGSSESGRRRDARPGPAPTDRRRRLTTYRFFCLRPLVVGRAVVGGRAAGALAGPPSAVTARSRCGRTARAPPVLCLTRAVSWAARLHGRSVAAPAPGTRVPSSPAEPLRPARRPRSSAAFDAVGAVDPLPGIAFLCFVRGGTPGGSWGKPCTE